MIKKAAAAVKAGQGVAGSPAANNADLQAGYELATLLGVEKTAAQNQVAQIVESTIRDGQKDAELFGTYYQSFLTKQAGTKRAGDDGGSEDHNKKGDPGSGANDSAGAGGDSGGGPGGGDGGGSDAGGAGGSGSLGDMLGGGADPGGLAGGGGAPGGPGGGAGGGPTSDQVLMELASALEEMGIPLDQLAQMGKGMGGAPGGAPGGMPGGAPGGMPGGMPGGAPGGDPLAAMAGGGGGAPGGDPMGGAGGAAPMSEGMKLASAVVKFKRDGKFAFKAANDGTPQRHLRDQIKGYIREMRGF